MAIITSPTFTAATTAGSHVFDVGGETVTIIGYGFSGTDAISVQITYDGTNYVDCYRNGVAVTVTSTNNPVSVYGPGKFKLNKGSTTGTVGASICAEI